MQRKQSFSYFITICVILTQLLAGVSGALPAQVALAAAPTPRLAQPPKPSEAVAAPAAGPELARPSGPEGKVAAPAAKPLAAGGPASISGLIYSDFNANGAQDTSNEVNVGGVTVTAYDASGVALASTTTSTATATIGQYTLSGLPANTPVRLEFTALPAGYQPAPYGAGNGTAVQFVTTSSGALSNINFGINYPTDYCQNNPFLCTAEMIAGDPQNATTGAYSTLKKWSYALPTGTLTPLNLANTNLVGSVWGLAYARGTDKLYSAAFLKRHAGLGPKGLGAIYVTNNPRSGSGVATSLFFDVATVAGVNVGTVPSNSARGLTTPSGGALDLAIYDQVGKVGLGDIDIADDESTLWTISLNDKKLLAIPINNPTAAAVRVYTLPDPGCAPGSGNYRPFATKFYRSQLYVGVTCDASLSLNRNDLKATVYRFDPAQPGAGFTPVLNIPLNYAKGPANALCTANPGAQWFPWVNAPYPPGFNPACPAGANKILPQPLLSDIEFDSDGSMIVGFIDRFAEQTGNGHALPDGTSTGETMGGGEILRAWNNNGAFVLENNGRAGPVSGGVGNNQGPGGGEFYRGEFIVAYSTQVVETAAGGLALLPGRGEAVTTIWDPFDVDQSHGVAFLSNSDGNANRRHSIGRNTQFAKGAGLGDLEILCDSAPIEIGNRVWKDTNNNGVQDPGEPGVPNVVVALYDSNNNRLAAVATDAQGAYYFSSAPGTDVPNAKYNLATLKPNTSGYQVRIDTTQPALKGFALTTADADSSANGDARDSDGQMSGNNAVVTFATGAAGANNHTYDFGFQFTGVAIGNYVWKDNNDDGLQDATDTPLAGVTVGLYQTNGNPVLCVQDQTRDYLDTGASATDSAGSLNWAGQPWTFVSAGVTTGGNPGNTVYVYGNGTATRAVDLSVFGRYPVLAYDFTYLNTTTAYSHTVEYSADSGVTWQTLANYTSNNGVTTWQSAALILPTLSATARVRIRGVAGTNANSLRIDNLRITGGIASPVTTVTDATGLYWFDTTACVQPSSQYLVRLATAQTSLVGLSLTTSNASGVTSNDPTGDDNDSDATPVTVNGALYASILATSPATGVNPSYDFGFVPVEIGNYVWKDLNANGRQELGEPGIPGVTVSLYDASGNVVMCPQVGRYDTYLDQFSTTLTTNSNGTLSWSSKAWVLSGAFILTTNGNPGGALQVNGGSATSIATRPVDLSVFASNPTLSFDYNMVGTASKFNILYSSNGGTNFTTLATLSDNNNGYKSITYTLPITVANAQIRIQGFGTGGGSTAYFDNLTIQGQVRYPVTTVTDSNGEYYFTGANCVQPSTTYQVRINTEQTPGNPLFGLFLTTQNAGGVTSNDPTGDDNDSDASTVLINSKANAVINATSPAAGINYSYDFGFTTVEIGNYVWKDTNANGLQERGEPGIPGVTVGLYDNSGNAVLCLQSSPTNLALNKTATQVSDYSASYLASNAVDGNSASGMALTNSSANSWWQVDLGQSAPLRQVVLYARPDGAGHNQTEQVYVLISNQPFASTNLATTLADPNVWHSALQGAWTGTSLTVAVPNYVGRYVRIQHNNTDYLALGEVQVYGDPALPVTTVTDANGEYYFTGANCVQPNTAYQVRLDMTQTPVAGLFLTTQNAGGVTSNDHTGDDSDSDASKVTLSGKPTAVINATSPATEVNYSYDFGFIAVEIGNYVWKDTNADGLQGSDEPGIPGVTVGLYDASGNQMQCTQVGRYDTYRDEFPTTATTATNTNSNGTLDWSGKAWTFAGMAGILTTNGNPGGSLRIYGSATTNMATRAVDLSVFANAPTLRFDYNIGSGTSFNVQYSSNGGTSFTTLGTLGATSDYQTITYTLPITAANAQIRFQGTTGAVYGYFDNLTIQGQVRYPVTTVTDSNGAYYFTGAQCMQPSTTYQVRLATTQDALFGLSLTTQNAGGVTSNDPTGDDSDSDASLVTSNGTATAVINATAPAAGMNYSYDFGFVPVEIGNFVWLDTNANGLQDASEPGIADVTVGLYDANGNAVFCPQLGSYGDYRDEFTTTGTTNSDGTLSWTNKAWVLTGALISASTGNPAGALMVSGGSATNAATRPVDLSVFAPQPTLSFDYNMAGTASKFNIQYSSDGGTSFTTLATLSDNNNFYKTITYTLPSAVANAQIRIQGIGTGGGTWAYFDNLTIHGQLHYPVTSVTDANGHYVFTGANCVQPTTNYLIQLDRSQIQLANLHLTTQNAGGVTSNDPTGDDSDSDAANVTVNTVPYARINATSPAASLNYSYDFGFTRDTGAIILRKATTPAGNSQTFSFTSNVPGQASFTLQDGGSYTMTQVPVGVYAVTETLLSGWTQAASTCTNGSLLGALQVSKNSTTVCNIINTIQPMTSNVLTVTKTVNWNGNPPQAGQMFNINLTGPSFPGGKADTLMAGETKVYTNIVAGIYTVAEQAVGWSATYSVTSGLSTSSHAVVTLTNSTGSVSATGPGVITGNVFRDYGANGVDDGVNDPGVDAVVVTAYDRTNAVRGVATADASGNYTLTTTGNGPYRLEFTNLPAGNFPTRYGTGNGTSTQFVSAPATNVNFGINWPSEYCQANPKIGVPNWYRLNNITSGNGSGKGGFTIFNFDHSGSQQLVAQDEQIGATWGVAYQKATKTIFAAAFTREYVDYGPLGRGGIYAINLSNPSSPQVSSFVDLQTLGVNAGGTGPRPTSVADEVGKTSLGDIDISEDGKTLYVMNLYERELVLLDLATKTVTQRAKVPNPGCASDNNVRPWAVEVHQGNVYVGLVCSAESPAEPLHAYVLRLQENGFAPFFNFPLSVLRIDWQNWQPGTVQYHFMPLFADMEFDATGALIPTILDLTGFRRAAGDRPPAYDTTSWGEMDRFPVVNGQLATTPTTFYNTGTSHPASILGGSALHLGLNQIASAYLPGTGINAATNWDVSTGSRSSGDLTISQEFFKGSGVGDQEILCDPAPLQIGNRVWKDLNGNGLQDPNEPGIANVTVALQSDSGTVTTNTDANGLYYFAVNPNTAYTITINPSQTALTGLRLTQANLQAISGHPSSNDPILDTRDSDGVTINGKATIYYTTGSAGQNNHGLDFGWTPPASGKVAINNKALHLDWGDNPDQYATTVTNTGAAHIIIPGLRLGATEDTETDGQPNVTATGDGADEDGVQFPTLTAGSTAVLTVTATNTGTTAALLAGWIDFNGDGLFAASERVTTTVPAGTTNGLFYLRYSVPLNAVSATYARFRLSTDPAAAQPTGVALDGEVEDYPVAIQTITFAQFGDRVWIETDNDGLASTGVITPVAGIVITATAGTQTYTTTTNSQGYYSFTVAPGLYTVRYGSVPATYGLVYVSATPGGNAEQGNAGSYQATGNPDASHVNGATIAVADGEANWQVDFAFHTPHADLRLVKQANKALTKPGDTLVYTLVLTNDGPDPAANVQVNDLLPTGMRYQSATAQQGSYDANTGVWTVGTLVANSSVTLTLTVQVR